MTAPDLFSTPAAKPPGWRAPTPGEHVCASCEGRACYGLGNTWFCRACVPSGYLPHRRSPRAPSDPLNTVSGPYVAD